MLSSYFKGKDIFYKIKFSKICFAGTHFLQHQRLFTNADILLSVLLMVCYSYTYGSVCAGGGKSQIYVLFLFVKNQSSMWPNLRI